MTTPSFAKREPTPSPAEDGEASGVSGARSHGGAPPADNPEVGPARRGVPVVAPSTSIA